jgi:hypothetical protein
MGKEIIVSGSAECRLIEQQIDRSLFEGLIWVRNICVDRISSYSILIIRDLTSLVTAVPLLELSMQKPIYKRGKLYYYVSNTIL